MSQKNHNLANIRRAAAVLNELKTTMGCVDCGFNAWPEALHFDHIDPTTKQHSLGWVADRSRLSTRVRLTRFLEHVARYCVIRCANCHAHRSVVEQHWRPQPRGEAAQAEGTLF